MEELQEGMHKVIEIILPMCLLTKYLQLPILHMHHLVSCAEIWHSFAFFFFFQSTFSKAIVNSFRACHIHSFQVERIRKSLLPAGAQSMLERSHLQSLHNLESKSKFWMWITKWGFMCCLSEAFCFYSLSLWLFDRLTSLLWWFFYFCSEICLDMSWNVGNKPTDTSVNIFF